MLGPPKTGHTNKRITLIRVNDYFLKAIDLKMFCAGLVESNLHTVIKTIATCTRFGGGFKVAGLITLGSVLGLVGGGVLVRKLGKSHQPSA